MTEKKIQHMSPDEFRDCGYAVVDWIAKYMEEVEKHPVLSQVKPGEVRGKLPPHPPREGEPLEAVLHDLDEVILPGITHWQSPSFFAYFPANASGPSILGDLLSSGLGAQGMLWATSPAATELETHVLDWLVEMLDLPADFSSAASGGGVIQDSASSATLCALLAAREKISEYQINERGVDRPLVAYASSEAHSAVEKAIKIAGVGRENLQLIDVDEHFRMNPGLLVEAIRQDKEVGRVPFFVCATVGTTSSSAIDPLPAIGQICRGHHIWLHVDGAYAGTAALCPEFRFINEGLELASSYTFNPHKWMLTNFDCSALFVTERDALIRSLTILPEYLRNQASESGAVIDYRDWQIPLGRRFRALKLWLVIRHYGVEGLRSHVRNHVEWAQELAGWIEDEDGFEIAAPHPLSLVCFRHAGGDEANQRLMDRLNASGKLYLSGTKLAGRMTLRIAIGGSATERRHVAEAWELIRETARAL